MKIDGTATFHRISVEPDGDGYIVRGHYLDSETAYSTPEVRLDGLQIELEGSLKIDAKTPSQWVIVESVNEEGESYIDVREEREELEVDEGEFEEF